MKIFLRDHDPESGWQASIEEALAPFFERYDESLYIAGHNCLPSSDLAFKCQEAEALLFLHTQGTLDSWISSVNSGAFSGHLIIVRSGGGATGYHGDNPRIHDCIWSPEQFVERPEPQSFVSALKKGLPLPWEHLLQQRFPASAISCCWLLAVGCTLPAARACLEREWSNTLNEISKISGLDHGLPQEPSFDRDAHSIHSQLRELLDKSWQVWAPKAPVVAIRNNIEHTLSGRMKRGEPLHDLADKMILNLRKLVDSLETGFSPHHAYFTLLEPLRSIPWKERKAIADHVNNIVIDRYVSSVVQECFKSCLERLCQHKRDTDALIFAESAQELCLLLNNLPNRIPMP